MQTDFQIAVIIVEIAEEKLNINRTQNLVELQ